MNRPLSLACGAVAVLLMAGCGASATSSTSESASATGSLVSATIPKSDFVIKANAICAAGNAQIAALGPAPGDPTAAAAGQLTAWSTYLSGVDTTLVGEASQLTSLPAPDQGQDQAGGVLTGLAAVIKDGGAAEAASRAGDLVAFQRAMTTYSTDAKGASSAATDFGLTECGK